MSLEVLFYDIQIILDLRKILKYYQCPDSSFKRADILQTHYKILHAPPWKEQTHASRFLYDG